MLGLTGKGFSTIAGTTKNKQLQFKTKEAIVPAVTGGTIAFFVGGNLT